MKKLLMLLLATLLVSSQNGYALLSEVRTGAVATNDGSVNPLQTDKTGSLVTSGIHGDYAVSAVRGNLWTCSDLFGTPVTTVAGLSALNPALTLFNPVSSQKNLVLDRVSINFNAAPAAAAAFALAFNVAIATQTAPTATTSATIQNAFLSNPGTPSGQCYRAATLVAAPVAFRNLGGTTGAAAISGFKLVDDTNGQVVIPPGVTVSIQSTSAAAIIADFTWEELPIGGL